MMQQEKMYSEKHESLWALTIAPLIWALHFLFCYSTAAVYCAKAASPNTDLNPVQLGIILASVLALAGIGSTAVHSYRQHNSGTDERPPHAEAKAGDRHRFIGFATLLLCGVSALATLYVAMAAFFFENCR
jgi:hypothetical protein